MILVDTSVWVNHLRERNDTLRRLLMKTQVVSHPFVVGEIACGVLRNRIEILGLFSALPNAKIARHEEVLEMLEIHKISGRGIGWVDAHLLCSCLLSRIKLWTQDKRLAAVARTLKISSV